MFHRRPLLAFVHIQKVAGTTLNHILGRNYPFRYVDVRPFSHKPKKIFDKHDLRKMFIINPALSYISGHSLRVCSDMEDVVPDIEYITILRDPLKRYVSGYLHDSHHGFWNQSFEIYLDEKWAWNRQTRMIVGNAGIEAAKECLAQRFLLVGITEEFDEFLILLREKLKPVRFDPVYRRENVFVKKNPKQTGAAKQLLGEYHAAIVERNQLDMELYQFVGDEILPRQRAEYPSCLEKDVAGFKLERTNRKPSALRTAMDYAFRGIYCDVTIGVIRKMNGLSYGGQK